MKRHIPNIITLCNVVCGCLSIVSAAEGNLIWAAYFIFIATVFDFADGLAARILKVQSEIGKQLDSLADMITFGVAPGVLVYYFLRTSFAEDQFQTQSFYNEPILLLCFSIPVFSALRLAKFNVDESQNTEFKGLATPACALFFAGLTLAFFNYTHQSFNSSISELIPRYALNYQQDISTKVLVHNLSPYLLLTCLVFSLLLVAPIRMFSFKFKNIGWRGNEIRYIFIAITLLVVVGGLLIKNIFVSVPIIILLYLITSTIYNIIRGKNEIQS